MPKHARAQNLAQIDAFWCQDTFKALKWAKNALKGQKLRFPSTLRAQMSSKSLINQLFLYESLFSYILAVCTWIFRPKFKKLDFEVIAGYLEKRISVERGAKLSKAVQCYNSLKGKLRVKDGRRRRRRRTRRQN